MFQAKQNFYNHIYLQFSLKCPLSQLRNCTKESKPEVTTWISKAKRVDEKWVAKCVGENAPTRWLLFVNKFKACLMGCFNYSDATPINLLTGNHANSVFPVSGSYFVYSPWSVPSIIEKGNTYCGHKISTHDILGWFHVILEVMDLDKFETSLPLTRDRYNLFSILHITALVTGVRTKQVDS